MSELTLTDTGVAPATVNLTALGPDGWLVASSAGPAGYDIDLGDTGIVVNYGNGSGAQIGTYGSTTYNWSNGTTNTTGSNTTEEYDCRGVSGGSVVVPADTTLRTLTIYLPGGSGPASIIAHLSDGSAPDVATPASWSSAMRVFQFTYAAASAGQTLKLSSTVIFEFAALTLAPGGPFAAASPAAPTALTATPGGGSIGLTWTAPIGVPPALGYDIWRESGAGFALIASITGTSYTDAAVVVGVEYCYYVTATNTPTGVSAPSNAVSAELPRGGSSMERSTVFQGLQVGVETTPGTLVAATKRLLSAYLNPVPETMVTPYRPWGSKANTAAVVGKEYTKASLKGTLDYDDILYWLASHLVAPGAPTRPNSSTVAYQWGFNVNPLTPAAPATLTCEVGGAQGASKFGYGVLTDMDLKFSDKEATLDGTMIGQLMQDNITITPSLPEVPVVPVDPSQVSILLGTASGALTPLLKIIEADLKIGGRFKEQMFLDPTTPSFSGITEEAPAIAGKITTEQNSDADNLLANLRGGVLCYVGIQCTGPAIDLTTTPHTYYTLNIELPVFVEKTNRGDHQGVYESEYDLIPAHDATFGLINVTVINKIAAL